MPIGLGDITKAYNVDKGINVFTGEMYIGLGGCPPKEIMYITKQSMFIPSQVKLCSSMDSNGGDNMFH